MSLFIVIQTFRGNNAMYRDVQAVSAEDASDAKAVARDRAGVRGGELYAQAVSVESLKDGDVFFP